MKNIPSFEDFLSESLSTTQITDVDQEMRMLGFEFIPYKEVENYIMTTSGSDIAGSYKSNENLWIHPNNPKYGISFSTLFRYGGKPSVSRYAYSSFKVIDVQEDKVVFEKSIPKSVGPNTNKSFISSLNTITTKILKNKNF